MELTAWQWRTITLTSITGFLLGTMILVRVAGGGGSQKEVCIALLLFVAGPAVGWMRQNVVAKIDGDTLHIGPRSAPLAELVDIEWDIIKVNFMPVMRSVIFVFPLSAQDPWIVRAAGAKRLTLPLNGVIGGKTALRNFADAVRDASLAAKGQPVPAPIVAEPQEAFDADAIMARYLATRATFSPPPAPGFGRKGITS